MFENTDELALRLTENGCRKDIVDTFHRLFIENDITRAMYILRNYRNELQETLDHECKLIDCIDCLIYELETKS